MDSMRSMGSGFGEIGFEVWGSGFGVRFYLEVQGSSGVRIAGLYPCS